MTNPISKAEQGKQGLTLDKLNAYVGTLCKCCGEVPSVLVKETGLCENCHNHIATQVAAAEARERAELVKKVEGLKAEYIEVNGSKLCSRHLDWAGNCSCFDEWNEALDAVIKLLDSNPQ